MSRPYRPYLVIHDGIPVWTTSATGSPTAAEIRATRRKAATNVAQRQAAAPRCECAYGPECPGRHPEPALCGRLATHIVTRTRGRFAGSRYPHCHPCAEDAARDVAPDGTHEFTAEPIARKEATR